jgi:V8-like Glu-specific endopeptidase
MIVGKDKETIIALLADEALNSPIGPLPYFKNLVLGLALPPPVVRNRAGALQGVPDFDARNLVEWALNYGTIPNSDTPALGAIILKVIPQVGLEKMEALTAILINNGLAPSAKLGLLQVQYQIPARAETGARAGARIGPEFEWDQAEVEKNLQSWLFREPEYIEGEFIKGAASRLGSVCRVEVGATGERGTGVRVGRRLVLTNFHIIAKNPDDLRANAQSVKLRFGAFRAKDPVDPDALEGQEISVDPGSPLRAASPVQEHDFALLRADESITAAADLSQAPILAEAPALGSPLHILQHPRGGPMMVARSMNGVAKVDAARGLVQYVTRAANGSSGSPCFDKNWNFIALHHAEESTAFGSIREGILMQAIRPKIADELAKDV